MATHIIVAFLGRLLRQSLDVFVPGHHGVVTLGAEDPGMSAMHGSGLAALEDKLVGGASLGRMRAELLFREVKRHDRRLGLVRRLEFVEVSRRKDIPIQLADLLSSAETFLCTYHPAV
jgi:hypothetical protein